MRTADILVFLFWWLAGSLTFVGFIGLCSSIGNASKRLERILKQAVSSDARKICRAFDAAEERESMEVGI